MGEFNCSCVGISKFQACASPTRGSSTHRPGPRRRRRWWRTRRWAAIKAIDILTAKKPQYLDRWLRRSLALARGSPRSATTC